MKNLEIRYAKLQAGITEEEVSKDVARINAENKKIKRENKKIKRENKELERRDNYHDGSNTPPSNKTITQQSEKARRRKKKSGKKRSPGAQKGHQGAYHKTSKPDRETHVKMCKCKECNSKNIHKTKETVSYREDTIPSKKVTTRETVDVYTCLDCGEEDMTANDDKNGIGAYGPNVVLTVIMYYLARMPNRLNADMLKLQDIIMSSGTISSMLKTFGMRLYLPAQKIMQQIRRARILHIRPYA